MKKYVLASVNSLTMKIMIKCYDSYDEAFAEMKKEYEEEMINKSSVKGSDIYEYSAYIISDYDYSWEIQSVI